MAKDGGPASSPPIATTPTTEALKKSTSSTQNMKNQKSILGFFQLKSSPVTPSGTPAQGSASHTEPASSPSEQRTSNNNGITSRALTVKLAKDKKMNGITQNMTPVPSSDMAVPDHDEEEENLITTGKKESFETFADISLPSPVTSTNGVAGGQAGDGVERGSITPSRRVRFRYLF
jgi:Ulp1 family protease